MPDFHSLRRLTVLVFPLVVVIGGLEAPRYPLAVLIVSICFIVGGIPISVYGFRALERYKNVFDFEPAELWGKAGNGKQARQALMGISTAGLWLFLSGMALLLIDFPDLKLR